MTVDHVFWLTKREHAALLAHAVCGDRLAHPDEEGVWFEPTRASRSDRLLLLGYETAGATLRLCTMLPQAVSVEWIAQAREQASPVGAERKWAHFVGQLGRFERAVETAPHWTESTFMHEGRQWRARRQRHPSAVIDRLLMRDRAENEDLLRSMIDLFAPDIDVGGAPQFAPRPNVGDSRAD